MIQFDYNQPDNVIYIRLNNGDYCQFLDSLLSEFGYFDKRYSGFDGWVLKAQYLEAIMAGVTTWLKGRQSYSSTISFKMG